jgi:uncharacterized protein (TIGR03086 family)
MGMTASIDDLVAAAAFFGAQVVEVQDEQWTRPTPCEGWTVRALVSHVVVQDSQVKEVLEGGTPTEVIHVDESILGHHPVGTWRGTALAALDAFKAPGVLEATFPHPLGEVDGATLLGFRLVENLVHGWDIARACERDVDLDDHLATLALDFFAPRADGLLDSGHFGEGPTEISPDAPVGERLLAFCGRRV